jgi:hypothetical protein
VTFLLVGIAACSSGSGNSGTSVAQRCYETIETLCERNADCAVAIHNGTPANRAEYIANCTGAAKTTLDCSRMTQLTGNPDACEADYASLPCSLYVDTTGLPMPASCKSLFR